MELISKFSNLENENIINLVSVGFQKFFEEDGKNTFRPFIGAGFGYAMISLRVEDETSETTKKKDKLTSFASYWEVGLMTRVWLITGMFMDLKIIDQSIDKSMYGNLQLGGRIASAGLRYQFP
jgi:outer membrane protein W